VTKVVDHR